MRLFRSARWILMTLLLSLVPASSYAGVFISVGVAPPVLPVYEQPVCPEPGLMWTPGYWGYGPDGYYWVPGAWVPAPYVGALWTPGYWGWSGGLYVWHGGYWGPHVGYYGGVNYGFGYMGVGFAGGLWRGGVFAYNRAVVRVGVGGGWGGNRVYVDRTIVQRTTIINDRHVAFSGGPGGINHAPRARRARRHERASHVAPTSFQSQHMNSAMADLTLMRNSTAAIRRTWPRPDPSAAKTMLRRDSTTITLLILANRPGGNSFGSQSRPANQNQFHATPQNNQFHPQSQQRPESRPAPQSASRAPVASCSRSTDPMSTGRAAKAFERI